jgi:cephalosporin-C deacetylase-like acetyl esterase
MAAEPTPAESLHRWFIDRARKLRGGDELPRSPAEARTRGTAIRRRMQEAERAAYDASALSLPFEPQVLKVLDRDGYRVENLIFQTRPGCFVTANTYLPATGSGPYPAVLCVHGHWAGARRDPVVQSRCIGLAKLGFVVLTLDAWGAGERGTKVGTNEYHGGLLGASLWPVGTPLHGLQLFDNVRALSYLQSRPEVDGKRLGCTGASGGGNQTTFLSAFDERIRCAVPVCSVGTWEDYLSAACCVDEVLADGLTFAEEGDLLGMVAPRALMVITASRDVYHFAPESAGRALQRARGYFSAHGVPDQVQHRVFESGHDYSRPMREAMYGWMTRWLKSAGDGAPIPEPEFKTEDPETLRCFPPPLRPGRVVHTVRWVQDRAEALRKAAEPPAETAWEPERSRRLQRLRQILALPEPSRTSVEDGGAGAAGAHKLWVTTESGVRIPVLRRDSAPAQPDGNRAGVLLLHPGGAAAALATPLAGQLTAAGLTLFAPDLRGCGELTLRGQGLGAEIPDHNLVEWSLWTGRPLLGQWVFDALQLLSVDLTGKKRSGMRLAVVGWREAGLAAILAGALDTRVRGVAALEPLASFTGGGPPHQQRMVVFTPDLLEVGDVSQLTALCAPRPALIEGPLRLDGMPSDRAELQSLYASTRRLYESLRAGNRLAVEPATTVETTAARVTGWLDGD